MIQFTPEQTVELDKMFQRCGFEGAEWLDVPAWIIFTQKVPVASGSNVLTGLTQSVGNTPGADFFLRRIQTVNFFDPSGFPAVYAQIKLPTGRYLTSGSNSTGINLAGALSPPPTGLVKPEIPCPAGSKFIIDLQNVSATFEGFAGNAGADITASIIFVGVYRYRLTKAC